MVNYEKLNTHIKIYFYRLLTRYDRETNGRSRVHQTADLAILYLNTDMTGGTYGIANARKHVLALKGSYGKD